MKRDVCEDKVVRDGRQGENGSVQAARETSITLDINERFDVRKILDGLENYRSPRRPWHWREGRGEPRKIGAFEYLETSESLENSVPLPGSRGFGYIDPQPDCVITTEIASGRFEDDIRRMRMAEIGRASCRERV